LILWIFGLAFTLKQRGRLPGMADSHSRTGRNVPEHVC
jgi:hypothetical protein